MSKFVRLLYHEYDDEYFAGFLLSFFLFLFIAILFIKFAFSLSLTKQSNTFSAIKHFLIANDCMYGERVFYDSRFINVINVL